jgi:hypothetical protein
MQQRKTISTRSIRRQNLASPNVNYEMHDGRRRTSGLKSLLKIERQDESRKSSRFRGWAVNLLLDWHTALLCNVPAGPRPDR